MPILKFHSGHDRCEKTIYKHLEDQNVVAFADAQGFMETTRHSWAYTMDKSRIIGGNDTPWARGKAVTYQHLSIYPDHKDALNPEQFLFLLSHWAGLFFGWDFKPGLLGSFECVIYVVERSGKLEGHVVVNNTNQDTGYRLRISRKDNHRLFDYLQAVFKAAGYSGIDTDGD